MPDVAQHKIRYVKQPTYFAALDKVPITKKYPRMVPLTSNMQDKVDIQVQGGVNFYELEAAEPQLRSASGINANISKYRVTREVLGGVYDPE